jgi:myosin-crossreactive antigen
MKELIEVFRMNEIDPKIRARIIIKLGKAINDKMSMNTTEPIVFELVKLLDEENDILSDKHYIEMWNK